MNIPTRPPEQKPAKVKKNPAYLAKVRQLPCCVCGRSGIIEAHHCRDLPDFDERGLYKRLPGAAQKSADEDAIPLCSLHHRLFHLVRSRFHAQFGRDYSYIAPTRAKLADGEVDF